MVIVGLGSPDQLLLSWTFSPTGRQVDTREWRVAMMDDDDFKF